MRATGIVRRIDDLGRIVLPKEIRKNLKIKEGDMLEIYVQDNGVIMLEKYEPMDNLAKIADQYVEVISSITDLNVCITTDSYVISAAGKSKKEFIRKDLSENVINILEERIVWSTRNDPVIPLLKNDDKSKYMSQIIIPIIDEGDVIGSVIAFSNDSKNMIKDSDITVIKLAASLLEKQME